MDELLIPYPDFKMGDVIDPEQHDLNNAYIVNKVNEFVDFVNELIDPNGSGASKITITPTAPFTATNVQDSMAELITRLQSVQDGLSGADLVGSTTLVKLPGNTVQAQLDALDAMLQTAYVISTSIADGAVLTVKLADGAVTNVKLGDGSVSTAKLIDASITNAKIAAGAVTIDKLAENSVGTTKVIDGSITNSKLSINSVSTDKVVDASITSTKIADGNVTNAKLALNSVTTQKIADYSVTTEKMVDSSITQSKLANQSVASTKIQNNAIKVYHLDPSLLEMLPNSVLTQKVLALESNFAAHEASEFPHFAVGGTYKVGIGYNAELDCVQFVFREEI